MPNNKRILCVDDDPNIWDGYRGSLKKSYEMHTAAGPEEGLNMLRAEGPFAVVVVSDYAMPGMNGVEFLKQARVIAPDTVRIMLTGFASVDNALAAINEGNVFRFLTKPCEPEILAMSLDAGLEQYRLKRVEKELLEKTLLGSVRVMSQILSLVNPAAFSRTSRIKYYMQHLARELKLSGVWRFELASMLCQLGCITLSSDTLSKVFSDQQLTDEERDMYRHHPEVAADLLRNIPRLQSISKMIEMQQIRFASTGCAEDKLPEDITVLGACMLSVALGFDRVSAQEPVGSSVRMLGERQGQYHPLLLKALATVKQVEREMQVRQLKVHEIKPFMIADEEVRTKTGVLLMAPGQEVSNPILERLSSFSRTVGVVEPVRMRIPL